MITGISPAKEADLRIVCIPIATDSIQKSTTSQEASSRKQGSNHCSVYFASKRENHQHYDEAKHMYRT